MEESTQKEKSTVQWGCLIVALIFLIPTLLVIVGNMGETGSVDKVGSVDKAGSMDKAGSVDKASTDVEQYIGVWEAHKTKIEIEAKPGQEVKKSYKLRDGKEAKLVLPVNVRNRNGASLWLMTLEGIYNVEGKDALIFHCELCHLYVIFGLRRNGANLEVGLPGQYGDRHIHDAMWNHGQSASWFRYANFKWVTYEPVAKP